MQTKSILSMIFLSWLLVIQQIMAQSESSSDSSESAADGGNGGGGGLDIEDLLELLGDTLLPFENIVTSTPVTGTSGNAMLLTSNALVGNLQSIYRFPVATAIAATGQTFETGGRDPPPGIEPPTCATRQFWLQGGGLPRTLSLIDARGDSSRSDVAFAPRVAPFDFVAYLDPESEALTGILVDCNQNLLGVSATGYLYLIDPEEIEDGFIEPQRLGSLPGITSGTGYTPITYDFTTGYMVAVVNSGTSSTMYWYSIQLVNGEGCGIEPIRIAPITAANDCGDGDISAIQTLGDTLYVVVCSTGAGTAGTPQVATLSTLDPAAPAINEATSGQALDLFEDVTQGAITGIITTNREVTGACEIAADDQCTDLSLCE